MSKVKLIVRPYSSLDSGHVVPTTLGFSENMQIVGVIRYDFEPDKDGSTRVSDDIVPVIPYERINDLVGKLKTQIDASIVDATQREAMKDLFGQIAWNWYTHQTDQLHEPWREDKKNTEAQEKHTKIRTLEQSQK